MTPFRDDLAPILDKGTLMAMQTKAPVRPVRHPTLWEMCVWVYRDQRAHVFLKRPIDWFLWSIADWVEDGPRRKVDRDAATLHAEVLELGQRSAELIAFHAAQETQPEPPLAMPEPFPTTPDRAKGATPQKRTRWGQSEFNGKQEDYLIIATDDVVFETVPVWERYGRKGMRQVGTRRVRRPIEYCPITWLPDIAWVESEAAVHRDWLLAMNELYDRLENSKFRDHMVIDFGIGASYVEIEPQALNDTRSLEFDQQYPLREVEVSTGANRIVAHRISNGRSQLLSTRAIASIKRS